MNIATSRIKDFDKTIDAGGSIVFNSDDKATITTSSISQRAFLYKRLPAIKGETITVVFKARGNLGAAIDYPNVGGQSYKLEIDTDTWNEHELSYTVPDYAVTTDFIQIAIGQYTGFQGTAEITDVRIKVEGKLPVLRCYGAALLAVNDNFTCIGFDRDQVNAATVSTSVILNLKGVVGENNARSAPIFTAGIDNFNASTHIVDVRIGGYNRVTGDFTLSFVDTSTGNLVDASTLGVFYIWIKAEGA